MHDDMAKDENFNTLCIGRVIHTPTTLGLITRTYTLLTHWQTSCLQIPLQLDDLQYKETTKNPSNDSHPLFTLALQYFAKAPPIYCPLCVNHSNLLFAFHTPHDCPTMSRSSSPIFIPSCSVSPANSVGNTPYIVTSSPPDSPTSDEMALPHEQMIEHIAHLLNIEEEEVHRQFPTVHSLLPIDRSPPTPTSILTPDTLMLAHASTTFNDVDDYKGIISPPTLSYPGTEFENYSKPNLPNSPPIPSPEPLPVPPPHFHDSISVTPPTTSATNSTYTSPVIPTFIEKVPSCSPSPISPMAMVLYQQAEANALKTKMMNADAEGRTPSPTGPQPGVHPGPGWKDNFDAVGTHHFFVISDGDKDVIAPFISYDLHTTFPELLATNGCSCTIHSCPLHAHPVGQHHMAISPKDKLLLTKGAQFTDLVDWALTTEEDPTLQGKVQYFCAHHTKANQIAHRIGALKESLQNERLAMYQSSDHLATANAIARIRHRIDHDMHKAPYFKGKRGHWAQNAIRDHAIHAWGKDNGKICDWCGRTGRNIEDCHCLGYCRHCSCRGHDGTDCLHSHDFCNEFEDCKVYPSHPNFECSHCAAVDDDIDI